MPELVYSDEHWMRQALDLAYKAEAQGEVPIGAVLVLENNLIGSGFNCPIGTQDPTAHAELRALRAGAQTTHNYRIPGSVLYVTLEPCAMCLGAMQQARIARVVYGAEDPKKQTSYTNHRFEETVGVLGDECGVLLRTFFQARR